MTQLSDCLTVKLLLVCWCLQHCLLQVDSSCSGGCQKKQPVNKEDIIPALRAYILKQLGLNETGVSNFTKPFDTETEEMAENKLVAEIEDSQPAHLQSHTGAKAVKTYSADHARRGSVTSKSTQRKLYYKVHTGQLPWSCCSCI